MAPSPFAFDPHPGWWIGAGVTAVAFGAAVRRPGWSATRREVLSFLAGELAVLAAVTWPVGDLAAHWLLLALVLQRLLLMLVAAPLLLAGIPATLLASVTRPAPVDAVVQWCSRPAVAVAVVTVVSVGTLTTGAVDLQAHSGPARAAFDLVLLGAGVVLWTPVLNHVPGIRQPGSLGRAAYLVVQSIVPSFLSVVWILSRHPLYPVFDHHRVAGLGPLPDQIAAGFTAKLTTIAVLWSVAFVLVHRSERTAATGGDPDPVTWTDVQREFERADRRRRRSPLLPVARAPWEHGSPWPGTGWSPAEGTDEDGPPAG